MPFFVVEGAEISDIEQGDAIGETKRNNLVRGMMQRIARHPFHFLADPVLCSVEPFAPPGSGFRSTPLFLELGQGFGPALLDGPQATTRHR